MCNAHHHQYKERIANIAVAHCPDKQASSFATISLAFVAVAKAREIVCLGSSLSIILQHHHLHGI